MPEVHEAPACDLTPEAHGASACDLNSGARGASAKYVQSLDQIHLLSLNQLRKTFSLRSIILRLFRANTRTKSDQFMDNSYLTATISRTEFKAHKAIRCAARGLPERQRLPLKENK